MRACLGIAAAVLLLSMSAARADEREPEDVRQAVNDFLHRYSPRVTLAVNRSAGSPGHPVRCEAGSYSERYLPRKAGSAQVDWTDWALRNGIVERRGIAADTGQGRTVLRWCPFVVEGMLSTNYRLGWDDRREESLEIRLIDFDSPQLRALEFSTTTFKGTPGVPAIYVEYDVTAVPQWSDLAVQPRVVRIKAHLVRKPGTGKAEIVNATVPPLIVMLTK